MVRGRLPAGDRIGDAAAEVDVVGFVVQPLLSIELCGVGAPKRGLGTDITIQIKSALTLCFCKMISSTQHNNRTRLMDQTYETRCGGHYHWSNEAHVREQLPRK